MPHFAARTDVGEAETEDVERLVARQSETPAALIGAYWTPDNRQVFSVFESRTPLDAVAETDVFSVLPITAEEYGPPAVEPAAGEGDGLQLVLVRRQLNPMTEREFRAVALQAIMCAHEYEDMLWLRSYWDVESNQLNCLFRTRTHDLVREHAERSRIPCNEIHDAVEVGPGPQH